MKLKTLLFFIVGLGFWLLLTNYQVVYSKLESFTSSSESTPDMVVDENDATINKKDDGLLGEESFDEKQNIVTEQDAPLEDDLIDSSEEEVKEVLATTQSEETSEELLDTEVSNEQIQETDVTQATETAQSNTDEEEPDSSIAQDIEQPQDPSDTAQSDSSATSEPETTTQQNLAIPNMMWMPTVQNNPHGAWMNPMYNMMVPMMAMMGTMMNPSMYMNPMTMMNYPITGLTQPQSMDAMMRSMDPKLMFGMFGQPNTSYKEGEVPDQLPVATIPGFPTQLYQNWPKNKVSQGVSREAKKNAFQTAMAMSPLSMRDMLSIMADKIPVAEDVTWDDAVEAMKLRANEVNFKFVGSSPLWKQIEAETEQPSAKVEMFRFCDATVARKILDEVPEFIVFLPCKIALIEDADGKLWVMTLDWDVSWLDYAQNSNNHLPKEIREDAVRIRENLRYIMEGAATGDF